MKTYNTLLFLTNYFTIAPLNIYTNEDLKWGHKILK